MSGFENDVVFALNADFTQADNQAPVEANGLVTDGQIWVGSTATNAGGTHINVGSITSPDSSVTIGYSSPNITLQVAGGSAITSVTTSNATPQFVLTGTVENVDFGITNLVLGSSLPAFVSGFRNVGLGQTALNGLINGSNNTAIGFESGKFLDSSANNTALGTYSLFAANGAAVQNVAIGMLALPNVTTGQRNVGVGYNVLSGLTTGSDNIGLGDTSGSALSAISSSNIVIGSFGVSGDNNTLRIGKQGSLAGEINRTFIAGIKGITTSNSETVTIDTTTGQLGSTPNITPSNIKITTYNVVDSPATWTKDARTKVIEVFGWAGGGGGGSGRNGASATAGGGGGGSCGGGIYYRGTASFFNNTETVIIGAGGIGGASQNSSLTNGNPGVGGGNTSFGNMLCLGGDLGLGGTTAGAGGGVGRQFIQNFANAITGGGGGGGTITVGGSTAVSNVISQPFLGSSGGGGGGANNTTERAGGNGTNRIDVALNVLIAGGVGGLESTGINGANGNPQLTVGGVMLGGTGGGGGGGYSVAAFPNGGGNGGNGAIPSGGGGGGGGGIGINRSGAGGNGADGRVVVIEYF